MGDSDEEYDRRRGRDKFRRERSDYTERRRERDERSSRRDDWSDRNRRSDNSWDRRRGEYRDMDRGRRESSGRHHEMSPPMKRVRRDWDEPYHGDQSFVPYGGGGMAHHGAWGHPNMDMQQMQSPQDARQQRGEMDSQSNVPVMMTFKQFLNAQEDNIDDMEAVRKYQEYKLEFKKTQMADFFMRHKEEEWFRNKYHPRDAAIRQKEAVKSVKKRLAVFLDLLSAGRMDKVTLDVENTDAIIKVLDAVVIKLEGGNDNDLAILDRPQTPTPERQQTLSNPLASPVEEEKDGERGQSREVDDGNPKTSEDRKDCIEDESAQSHRGKAKAKTVAIPEAGPVSPSSVPLPDTPAPPSKKSESKKKKDSNEVKPIAMPEPTAEQKQLQQQAQYYHQQQIFYQQQQDYYARLQEHQQKYGTTEPYPYPPPQPVGMPPAGTEKKEEGKKKRKRRHREPYYYDEMDDSESESDSDSEPEPAPPGEEVSPMRTGEDDELMPPGVDAPSQEETLRPPGVEESSTVEPSLQVPTSSSVAKLSSKSTENKPENDDQAVGSSEPESGSADGGMPASSTEGKFVNGSMDGPVAASSTEGVHDKSHPETSTADGNALTSSSDQRQLSVSDGAAADSTQSPESKSQSIGESSTTVSGSDKVVKTIEQVGSSDNGVSAVKSSEDIEMIPASTSNGADEQEKEAEVAVQQSLPTPSCDHQGLEEPKTEQIDSNKLAERKEAKEEESPMKTSPEKKSEGKENALEEKEKDTADIAEMEEGEELEGKEKLTVATAGAIDPRPLHKTYSLFIRNVPPNVSKADVAAVCKRFAGFLRIALSDPSPDRKFYRRGWITFDRSVTIKEICWDLNNVRVKECELNSVINRDLSRRVRPVAGFTVAKQIVRDDIKLAARIIRELDRKSRLYEVEKIEDVKEKEVVEKKEEGEEGEDKPSESEADEIPLDLPKENAILASLCEDAAEEEEGEEMELLGTASPARDGSEKSEVDLTRDESLLKVLDRLILYLRVVHSLDYYNGSDYPYEDEMPNRCGIIHVRGPMPEKATQAEVSDGQKNLKHKLDPFLQPKTLLSDEEVTKFGKKDPEAEIEKFVQANTEELAKDKWLCPLSGKKFRGPEFVRKHIFNKHIDKVEAVKMEAEFFNNYISDPSRPQNPEPIPQKTGNQGGAMSQMYGPQQHNQAMMSGWGRGHHAMMYGGPRGPYTPQYGSHNYGPGHEMYGGRGGHTYPPKPRRFGYGGGRNRGNQSGGFHRDPRQIVQYKDLDAPDDNDF